MVLPEARSMVYWALFCRSKGWRWKTCQVVLLGWQLWLHFKVAPFMLFFYSYCERQRGEWVLYLDFLPLLSL